jgi:hypothetical protein
VIRPWALLVTAAVLVALLAVPASASAEWFQDGFAESESAGSSKSWIEPFRPDLDEATKESEEPNHAGYAGGHSMWLSWPVYEDVRMEVRACGATGADLLLAVYTGSAINALTEVGSDGEENANGCVIVDFDAEAGTTYRIAIDAKSSPGTSAATVDFDRFAPNDDFTDAIVIPELPVTPTIDPELATSEPEEPDHPGNGSGNSVWFRWTASKDGLVRLNYCEFWGHARFAVYTGSALNALTLIASGRGGGSSCGGYEEARFEAEEGTTYSIAVEGSAEKTIRLRPSFEWVPKALLSVSKSGSGSGSVVSEPLGIECGAICEAGFYRGPLPYGQIPIELTATPDPGSVFVGWSGEGWSTDTWTVKGWGEPECGSEPVCEFMILDEPTEVTAEFEELPSLVISGGESRSDTLQSIPPSPVPAASPSQPSPHPLGKKPKCAKHKKKGRKAKAAKRRGVCRR